MKYIGVSILTTICLMLQVSAVTAQESDFWYQVTIEQQRLVGNELHFEVYLENIGSADLAIGECSFALTFNELYFAQPQFTFELDKSWQTRLYSSTARIIERGALPSIHRDHLAFHIKTPTIGGDENQNFPSIKEVSQNLADYTYVISATGTQRYRLGKGIVTNVVMPEQAPALSWDTDYPVQNLASAFVVEQSQLRLEMISTHGYYFDPLSQAVETTTSIAESTAPVSSDILIYPNPMDDGCTILLPSEQEVTRIVMYSLLGQKVFEKEVATEKSREIALVLPSDLPFGSYTIQLISRQGTLIGGMQPVVRQAR